MNVNDASVELDDQERKALLQLARASLERWLHKGRLLSPEEEEAYALGKASRRELNVFVSLHDRGVLRGCIGTLAADKPLFRAVAASAISAGTRDPRFSPLSLEELSRCEIDISVLGPFVPISSVEQIVVGQHGLLLEKGGCRGLLLPQVATQYGWDAAQFLRQTFIKAGLPPQSKIGDAKVLVFSACVFCEKDYPDLTRSSG